MNIAAFFDNDEGTKYATAPRMNRLSRWCRTWGATEAELQRTMLGDTEVTLPSYETTLGVTIHAAPAAIWPWLMQMGYRRGGLYSYDWLDRLFGYLDAPSAERILPEWQLLRVGDEIPIGRGGGFPVKAIEPFRSLVLGGYGRDVEWSWEFQLTPQADGSTRLVSRNRVWVRRTLRSRLTMLVIEPAAFLMTRKMLLGITRRAESLPVIRRMAA
jgi:hypothetical protein